MSLGGGTHGEHNPVHDKHDLPRNSEVEVITEIKMVP